MDRQTDREEERQTDRETDRQTDRQTGQTDRQTNRQTDQTDIQTDKQTDRPDRHRQTDRQTDTHLATTVGTDSGLIWLGTSNSSAWRSQREGAPGHRCQERGTFRLPGTCRRECRSLARQGRYPSLAPTHAHRE